MEIKRIFVHVYYICTPRTDLVERDDEGRALPAEEVDGLDRLRLQPNGKKAVGLVRCGGMPWVGESCAYAYRNIYFCIYYIYVL